MKYYETFVQFSFPIIIMKESRWFVVECPTLNLATQGKTEKEAKENIKDLIQEYLDDPDTPKTALQETYTPSFTYIPLVVSKKLLHGKT